MPAPTTPTWTLAYVDDDEPEGTILMSRKEAGVSVEIILTPDIPSQVWLAVDMGEEHRATLLDPATCLDAFHHPMLYVQDPQAFA